VTSTTYARSYPGARQVVLSRHANMHLLSIERAFGVYGVLRLW
jgi:hypothetical protein